MLTPWQDSADPCLYRRHSDTQRQASCPITLWQIDGEAMETVADFIFLGSKISADGDCSHEIKRPLVPWKKSFDQPRQHIKKQRHYFVGQTHLVKAMVFQ